MLKQHILLAALALAFVTISSCRKKEEPAPDPVASFTVNSPVKTGEVMFFENTSTDAFRYEWDFGDGTSSIITAPSKAYGSPGQYQVTLRAFNEDGTISSTATDQVEVGIFWDGGTITFSKADGADWTLAANQDRLNDDVWLTRADNQGLFNIARNDGFNFNSPEGTRWALGTFETLRTAQFSTWYGVHQGNPPSLVGQDIILHLVDEDVYIELEMTSWTEGGAGGGFGYTRSTP